MSETAFSSKGRGVGERSVGDVNRPRYKLINFGNCTEVPEGEDETEQDAQSYYNKVN